MSTIGYPQAEEIEVLGDTDVAPGTTPSGIPDILARIVEKRRERLRIARGKETLTEPPRRAEFQTPAKNPFLAGLEAQRGNAVIAEIKLGSPSLGSLVGTFDPVERAKAYKRGGAACLSVVVEPEFFYGDYQILTRCVEATGLPAIAKDFVVDPLQLRWASRAGATAVLLIAALYSANELRAYADQARKLHLVPLIETHDAGDIAKLDGDDWELVGVNNRNLRAFTVDLDTSRSLLPTLPPNAFKVAESGIHTPEDLSSLRDAGFDAYLIGEALVKSGDARVKLRQLLGHGDDA